MDFQSFKRRDLQSLCKLNKLPANTTNAAMAEALSSLNIVEGLEEFLGNLDSELQGSPERSAVAKTNGPRTTTRPRAVKEELECSNLATRTRCRTRTKAVEGTDTRKTPATRTTRRRASQQASIQKMDKDLQAEFEADMDQSQVSESTVLPGEQLQEVSEEVSGISVENEGQILSESQSEVQNEVNDGQEVIDVDDCEMNKEEAHVVNDVQGENSEVLNDSKVDFHSLSRKDLQNFCKKNRIPANMTNAAMADALDSLEFVEGLQEFVNGCDTQVPSSPLVSGITSSCARRSRTTQKITKEDPRSSKMITKSCRGSRRRITEETEQIKNDVPGTPAAPTTRRKAAQAGSALHQIQEKEDSVHRSEIKSMEDLTMETSEALGVDEFNFNINDSLMQEVPVVGSETALEDVNGKGNNDLPSEENSKDPVELVSQVGENVAEVIENAELSEVFTDLVKVDRSPEVVSNCATLEENLNFVSEDCEMENTEVQRSSNFGIDAEFELEDGQLENLENVNADDQLSKEVVSEFSAQVDQSLSMEMNDQNELGNSNLEEVVTTTEDDAPIMEDNVESGRQSVGNYTEDEMFEKSDSEATYQDDQLSMEVNVESESEGRHSEDEMSSDDKLSSEINVESKPEAVSDSYATFQDDYFSIEVNEKSESTTHTEDEMSQEKANDQLSLEVNVESKSESTNEDLVEKPEDCKAEDLISNKFSFDATAQEIPQNLSLRQLKKLYKERLKAAKLANKLENLTLEETENPLANVEEDGVVESANDESSVVVPQVIPEDQNTECEVEESEESVDTTKLYNVDILLDNEVTPEDAVIGNDVVTCAPHLTPSKCSTTSKTKKPVLTPTKSKSASKLHTSAGRKSVSDDNKENILSPLSSVKIAVTESVDILSPLSMAKLKQNIKFLKQQSEKKKQALTARSENLL